MVGSEGEPVPTIATNSTRNPDAGPTDPATSNMYQKSSDLSSIKEKYHLEEGQCFVFLIKCCCVKWDRSLLMMNTLFGRTFNEFV